jgi:predicted membrane protein
LASNSMRIFSNFDTKIRRKVFAEYQQEYWADQVLCFGRSILYRVIKVCLPVCFLIAFSVFVLILFYHRVGASWFIYVLIPVLIFDIVMMFPITSKYIDYISDFILVIPSCMIMYDQRGVLKRNVVTISAQSVKTISIKKEKFLYSVFDNGDVVILTEWDSHGDGEVILRRVPKPEKRRNQMAKLIWLDVSSNQDPH